MSKKTTVKPAAKKKAVVKAKAPTKTAAKSATSSKKATTKKSDFGGLSEEILLSMHDLMVKSRVLEERVIKIYKAGEGYFWIGGPGEEAFGVPLGLQTEPIKLVRNRKDDVIMLYGQRGSYQIIYPKGLL
jgi:2-oxoisovalerate dehydrogenase E1 component alpha subunit